MLGAVEEQAQRVAAEFQEVATGREGDVEQRGEGVVEDRGELLGTHPATRASRSESFVKPETSAKQRVPATIDHSSWAVWHARLLT